MSILTALTPQETFDKVIALREEIDQFTLSITHLETSCLVHRQWLRDMDQRLQSLGLDLINMGLQSKEHNKGL